MKTNAAEKLIKIKSIIEDIYGKDLHKKRQQSIALAAMGLLGSESLFLHRMAEGLVSTRGGSKKHATKQIDRLLSNKGISVWDLSDSWIKHIVGEQKSIVVALDWTVFYDDKQFMLCLNMVTSKGISTPLLWKSVHKNQLKYNRARYEDQMLSRLKEVLPPDTQVILLADRGFSDHKFLKFLEEELNFNYVIRVKSNTTIIHNDEKSKACEKLREDGKITALKSVGITLNNYPIKQFVAIKERGMKGAWFLATNLDLQPREIVNNYAKRWKIEPYFRDLKDGRFGLELQKTHIASTERRDRLMLVLALSYSLILILGQAGENIGFDKKLKVNTVKTRTHSVFRQGLFYYKFYYHFTEEEQNKLIYSFQCLLEKELFWVNFLNIKE
jgi:transposase